MARRSRGLTGPARLSQRLRVGERNAVCLRSIRNPTTVRLEHVDVPDFRGESESLRTHRQSFMSRSDEIKYTAQLVALPVSLGINLWLQRTLRAQCAYTDTNT